MTGLVLKLGPKERVLINGAVLENGSRRSRVSIITPSANVLRLKDAIHPDEANTPMGRLCYQLQLILAGSSSASETMPQINTQLLELSKILRNPFCQEHLSSAMEAILQGNYYSALKSLKSLLPVEQELLAHQLA